MWYTRRKLEMDVQSNFMHHGTELGENYSCQNMIMGGENNEKAFEEILRKQKDDFLLSGTGARLQ